MANVSVLQRYLKVAQDGEWNESMHHRADNGRFTSGSGRGKTASTEGAGGGKKSEAAAKEMPQDRAERIVRKAFAEAKSEIKSLKLIGKALHADVSKTGADTLKTVNAYLTKHGLKANIQDGNTYRIAEDEAEDPIAKVIAKGIYFKPEAKAQDAGTSEGARKGWETRKHGGAKDFSKATHGGLSPCRSLSSEYVNGYYNDDQAMKEFGLPSLLKLKLEAKEAKSKGMSGERHFISMYGISPYEKELD